MRHHTETEENYLKCILRFTLMGETPVSTNTIANYLGISPASVTDMLKKLSNKKEPSPLVNYTRYEGVSLTENGKKIALSILRKHRLWEVFLVNKLNFSWDNVHDVAEQLEHIQSQELISRLDEFLDYPKFDPHGDPIPSEDGTLIPLDTPLLSDIEEGETVIIASVKISDPDFLRYLERQGLLINKRITVKERLKFDDSLEIIVDQKSIMISGTVSENLRVLRESE